MEKMAAGSALLLAAMTLGAADAPRLLAHRGGMHEHDENTMGAFKACYEKGGQMPAPLVHWTFDGGARGTSAPRAPLS